jgi:hypothetical protein
VAFAASGEQGEQSQAPGLFERGPSSGEPLTKRGLTRLIPFTLALASTAVLLAPTALAAAIGPAKPQRPDLRPLWSAFPLRQPDQPLRPSTTRPQTTESPAASTPAESANGWNGLRIFGAIAATLLTVGGLAALAVSLGRRRQSRPRGDRVRYGRRLEFRLPKGGSSVTYFRRKLRPHRETSEVPEHAQKQVDSGSARERLFQYSLKDELATPEGAIEADAEPGPDEETEHGEANPADVASVGEEVGTVLKSAQEAAARIRSMAEREAGRLREEAESAAAVMVAAARQGIEADHAEGTRVRAEAEEYARETRAAADAFAEQRRSDAEREATKILSDARRRLADADAEIEQRMQQATAREHQRLEAIRADVAQYEERLDGILGVFREVSAQLEDLLGKRRVEHSGQLDVSEETLKDALLPDRLRSRVG